MPENEVSIKLGLDASEVEAGAKQVKSALDGAAKGGIAGFEAAREKVIALTKDMATLRGELLKTDDPSKLKQLQGALDGTKQHLLAARTEMRGMSLESRQANEQMGLLAAQFGVHLPQGLGNLIGKLPLVQRGLELAFSGAVIFTFVRSIAQATMAWDKFQESLFQAVGPISQLEVRIANFFGLLKDYSSEAVKAAEAERAVNEKGLALSRQVLEARLDLNAAGLQGVDKILAQGQKRIVLLQKERDEADKTLRPQYERLIQYEREKSVLEATAVASDKYAESAKRAAEAAKTFATHQQQLAVQLSASSGALQALHNLQEQEKAAEDLLAAKSDADAAIRVAGLHDVTAAIKDQVEAQQAQIEIQQESARKAKEVYEKTAQSIESFIDRVFLTARSVSDVLHQFLMQSLGSLTKWVSQMLASWLTGIKQMSGAGPGGGGILGSLLAGVFGIGGGGGGSGALTSALAFGGGGSALSLPGGGTIQGVSGGLDAGAISAFGAAAPLISGSQVLTGGAIPKALGGATSGIFGNAAFGALTPQSIFTLALTKGMLGGTLLSQAYNTGNPLEGAAGGYLASGGILGAVVGAILGMFGRGRAKEKAAGLEQGFEFAADDLYKQFYQHQVDYDSALQGMQTLIDQGRQKLLGAGLGRWGEQGAQNLTRVIQDEVRALEELEKQREATTANIAGLTLPEFLSGGPVLSNGFQLPGGGIPAILHPDEWVLNSRQVEILGRGFLSNLPRFAAGGPVGAFAGMAPQGENRASGRSITVNVGPIYQQPGENGEVFASRVVRAFKRAVLDGAL